MRTLVSRASMQVVSSEARRLGGQRISSHSLGNHLENTTYLFRIRDFRRTLARPLNDQTNFRFLPKVARLLWEKTPFSVDSRQAPVHLPLSQVNLLRQSYVITLILTTFASHHCPCTGRKTMIRSKLLRRWSRPCRSSCCWAYLPVAE